PPKKKTFCGVYPQKVSIFGALYTNSNTTESRAQPGRLALSCDTRAPQPVRSEHSGRCAGWLTQLTVLTATPNSKRSDLLPFTNSTSRLAASNWMVGNQSPKIKKTVPGSERQ